MTFGTDGDITAGIPVPAGRAVKLTSTEDYFFKVYDGCTLILQNIVLDGKNLATGGEHYFAAVTGATLVLEDGAVLKNNTSPAIRAGTDGDTNTVSEVVMNGGEISGNSARGVCLQPNYSSAQGKTLRFIMNGGAVWLPAS